jgi:predicted nucleotidyltransferase
MTTSQPIALLAERRDGILDLCRRFGVERLEVFGSAARGDFVPGKSDVDLLVRFGDTGKPGYADRFIGFAEALEMTLGCRVDLLTERSLRNPVMVEQVAKDKCTLYAA